MQKSDFQTRLKLLISYMDMTQKDFASFVQIRESSISDWCLGKCNPSQKNFNKIILATKVSPTWLMGYGSDEEIEDTKK